MTAEAIAAWRSRHGAGPHLTADVVLFTLQPCARLAVLLVERGVPPFEGMHALPGGFVRSDEELENGARRELAEETALTELNDVALDQLATFARVGRDPRARVVTIAHIALVPFERVAAPRGGDDAASARFHRIASGRPVDEDDRPLRLAFDHDEIFRVALDRLRARVTYTTAPFALMPTEFTLSELQTAYEAILERPLHRRAFRERVVDEGWVVPTGRTRGGAHRPAKVYRAATRELLWMRPWPEAAKVTGGLKTRAPRRRTQGT